MRLLVLGFYKQPGISRDLNVRFAPIGVGEFPDLPLIWNVLFVLFVCLFRF